MSILRKYWMWIALLLVVLASWWAMGLDDDATSDAKSGTQSGTQPGTKSTAAPTRKSASGKTIVAQYDPATALALINRGFAPREAMNKLRRDPFTIVSFEPPPPPPPPPPKPVAPPLRFKYLGALRDGDAPAVFLDNAGQLLIAHKGDTLAGQYRVLEINDTSMQLEYTPLAERQTLNFGR